MPLRVALAVRRSVLLPPALVFAGLVHGAFGQAETVGPNWNVLEATLLLSEGGAKFEVLPDGSYLLSGALPDKDVYVFEALSELRGITGIRIEAIPDSRLPTGGSGRAGNGNFVLSLLTLESGAKLAKKLFPVELRNPTADFSQDVKDVSGLVDGHLSTGWSVFPHTTRQHVAYAEAARPIDYKTGAKLRFRLNFNFGSQHALGRFRLSVTDTPPPLRAPGSKQQEDWAQVQQKINVAIADGVDYLLDQQELDGSFSFEQVGYRNGQTALVVYALLKSGVSRVHPTIRRAVEFLRNNRSVKTYSIACHILALIALNDEQDRERITQMVDELASWQRGGFAYPDSAVDFSNTQYAALALWAGARYGCRIPEKVWSRMADQTLKQQEEVKNPYGPAGFGYRVDTKPTGSMTAAGVAILAICEEQMNRRRGDIDVGKTRGLAWLAEQFSVRTNPDPHGAPNERWLHYYLYGLERVGGLLQVSHFGEHDWYREGARYLLDDQNDNGAWSTAYGEEQPNTCFALLFLNRATAATSGSTNAVGQKSYGKDDPRQDLSMRAAGDSPLALWISSFGDRVLREYTWFGEEERGPRVKQVEYHTFGERETDEELMIARIDGDPRKPAEGQRYAAKFTYKRPGTYWVYARATVLAPPERAGSPAREVLLDSTPLKIQITAAPDPMLYRYAGDAGRNLLGNVRARLQASSELNEGWVASQAVDNLQSRGWCSKDDDPRPSLVLDLEQPVKAGKLLLSHAVTKDKERTGRITKLRVEVNRKATFEFDVDPDPERKTEFRFPKKVQVRRLAFLVLETVGAQAGKQGVGLGEIELQAD